MHDLLLQFSKLLIILNKLFRYTVTVAGTTGAITIMKDKGLLKTGEVKEKMKDTRADLREKYEEHKEKMGERRDKIREDWDNAWEKYGKKKD